MRTTRRPAHAFFDFLFFLWLDEDVAGVERQIVNLTCVNQFRVRIKKKRLIVRIERINEFPARHGRIDLHGNRLDLLPHSQFRNEHGCVSRNAYAGHDHHRCDNTLSILRRNFFAAKKLWPGNFLRGQDRCAEHAGRREQWHRVARQRSGDKIDNQKWNCDSPAQTADDVDLAVRRKFCAGQAWQQKKPRQKITEAARNIENPTGKFEIPSAQPAGELPGPL